VSANLHLADTRNGPFRGARASIRPWTENASEADEIHAELALVEEPDSGVMRVDPELVEDARAFARSRPWTAAARSRGSTG